MDEHCQSGVRLLKLHLSDYGVLDVVHKVIDAAEDEPWQDDIAVFPADENVAEAVARDGQNRRDDLVVDGDTH